MINNYWKSFFNLAFFYLISLETTAQIEISNIEQIPKIKNGTTYIVMNDTSCVAAQKYKDVYKKYWTLFNVITARREAAFYDG